MGNKLKQLIIYVADRSKDDPSFGLTKLNKLLFVADFTYYGVTGTSITSTDYIHRNNGPAPEYMKSVLSSLKHDKKIDIEPIDYFGYRQKRVIPLSGPDLSGFTKIELSLVDDVILHFKSLNASELSKWTHELTPWMLTEEGETLPYHTIFTFFKIPVERAGLEWAKRELKRLREEEEYAH